MFVGKWSFLSVSWVFLSLNVLLVTVAVFTAFAPPDECVWYTCDQKGCTSRWAGFGCCSLTQTSSSSL